MIPGASAVVAKRRKAVPAGGAAFTLIELLVVVAIIALLVAILLPSLSKARTQGKNAACLSNLHQIGLASSAYAAETKDGVFPDWWTVGGSSYRVMPGMTTAYPGSKPEVYGLPAVYASRRILPRDSRVWTCPLNDSDVRYVNTYWWLNSDCDTQNPKSYYSSPVSPKRDSTRTVWVRDNYNGTPYISGQRRPREDIKPTDAGDRTYDNDARGYQGNNSGYFRTPTYYHRGHSIRQIGGGSKYGWGANGLYFDLSSGFLVVKAL
jgi:prepilin-type N-terminal cleavage/methylation domain-containing protein